MEEGPEIARVWEEARKALSIQSWTEEEGLFHFRIRSWVRELDVGASSVRSERYEDTSTTARNPMVSLAVDSLMRSGFIQEREDRRVAYYYGPDASILLSNEFLNGHCFRLAGDPDRPEVIGLAFEPVGWEVPGIAGVFWLDRETARLLFLEWDYVNAPDRLLEGVASGREDFERLPDGTWIIRRWWIRAPIRDATWIFGRKHLVGIQETGAMVSEVIPLGEVRSLPPPGTPGVGR